MLSHLIIFFQCDPLNGSEQLQEHSKSRDGSANDMMALLSDHLADCWSDRFWQAASSLNFLCCSEKGDATLDL